MSDCAYVPIVPHRTFARWLAGGHRKTYLGVRNPPALDEIPTRPKSNKNLFLLGRFAFLSERFGAQEHRQETYGLCEYPSDLRRYAD
jgi:hypothetical protein